MKRIVIDTNVLMDFLFKREGHEKAAEIFLLCSRGQMQGFICAHEITTLFYFLDKTIRDKRKIKKALSGILQRFDIIEVNKGILDKALASEIGDFEDAVIETSAIKVNADFILTRNIRDYLKSAITAITPEEFLALH